MTPTEAMRELQQRGSEQTSKTYRRHGVRGDLFGVSYADFKALARRIGLDQRLAESLWDTQNHDARVLATMIAAPEAIPAATLDAWVANATNPPLADAVAGLAARSPEAVALMERWIDSPDEWVASAGWGVLAHRVAKGPGMDEARLLEALNRIEARIHQAPNRVRYSMNGAVIAIGCVGPSLRERALAAAGRIGKVRVDHGDTGCKTPDAAAYILKAAAREGKAAR